VLVSRSHAYHRRGLWAIKAKHGGAFLKAEMPVVVAEPKFYPADNTKPRKPSTRKPKPRSLGTCVWIAPLSLVLFVRREL
jgi:large subunit ribosomal protein L6e